MKNSKLFLICLLSGQCFLGLGAVADKSNMKTVEDIRLEQLGDLNEFYPMNSVDFVSENEQELYLAVRAMIIDFADRSAIYAKRALDFEKEAMKINDLNKRRCMQDTSNFLKILATVTSQDQIRAAHRLFADRYVQCHKIMRAR